MFHCFVFTNTFANDITFIGKRYVLHLISPIRLYDLCDIVPELDMSQSKPG